MDTQSPQPPQSPPPPNPIRPWSAALGELKFTTSERDRLFRLLNSFPGWNTNGFISQGAIRAEDVLEALDRYKVRVRQMSDDGTFFRARLDEINRDLMGLRRVFGIETKEL